jgi:hypothetical protein
VLPLGLWEPVVFMAAMLTGMVLFGFIPADGPRAMAAGRLHTADG